MGIDKKTLKQYLSLKQELIEIEKSIKKTEMEIERLIEDGSVAEVVTGGDGGKQRFKVEGFPESLWRKKVELLNKKKTIHETMKIKLLKTITEIEEFLTEIEDSLTRRIIRMRIIENMSWKDVAKNIGEGYTDESVKKIFHRFLKN